MIDIDFQKLIIVFVVNLTDLVIKFLILVHEEADGAPVECEILFHCLLIVISKQLQYLLFFLLVSFCQHHHVFECVDLGDDALLFDVEGADLGYICNNILQERIGRVMLVNSIVREIELELVCFCFEWLKYDIDSVNILCLQHCQAAIRHLIQ